MERLIVASIRQGAGKTSMIIGMARALGDSFGYMKPFGERVLYRKKRLLDYDSALIKNLFSLEENPEEMSIGFDHSKLRYIYDREGMKKKLSEMSESLTRDKDILFIDTGKDLTYGSSVELDPLTIAEDAQARLILVISGDDDSILDDLIHVKKRLQMNEIDFGGIILNKVNDMEDFKETMLPRVKEVGLEILGIIPFRKELTYLSMEYISDSLFAKVLAGGDELVSKQVENIFIGAMSGDAAQKTQLFNKGSKLIITSGDRSDMIIAALDSDTAGIILTNNIIPPSKLIQEAEDKGIPMLLVPSDTFRTAKQVDDMEKLLTKNDLKKVDILSEMVSERVDLKKIKKE